MKRVCAVAALCVALAGCASQKVNAPDQVLLHGSRLFPESITSLRDGTLIIGSIGEGAVYRWRPGEIQAERWIQPGTAGLLQFSQAVRGSDDAGALVWNFARLAPCQKSSVP